MQGLGSEKRILALDLRASSFGFVAFEGPTRLLDYGVRSFRQGINAVKIPASTKIATLMEQYEPSTIVLKQWTRDRNEKRGRMRKAVMRQADLRRIPVRLLSHGAVRKTFVGNDRNKYTIASALAQQFPELSERLPPKRKIWQSEDYRMSIFDAAALGVAYFKTYQLAARRSSHRLARVESPRNENKVLQNLR